MRIFCLSGKAGSGKDTAAEMMRRNLWGYGQRVLIIHNADLLKFILEKFLHWNGQKDEYGRELLQRVGTDIFRKRDPDWAVGFIVDMLHIFEDKHDYVFIPDARFPNEIDVLKREFDNVVHVRVDRTDDFESDSITDEQKAHISETALDDRAPDKILINNGNYSDFYWACMEFIAPYLAEDSVKWGV